LLWCQDCEFAFQPYEPAEVRAEYGSEYFQSYGVGEAYSQVEAARYREAAARVNWVRRLVPSGARLLEIGSAAGFFLHEARAAGWGVVGIEPSDEMAAEAGKRSGATVHTGFVEDIDLTDEAFDVICGWHVLEHIPDPLPLLRSLQHSIRPGGYAAFEVPNFASVNSRYNGSQWRHLDAQHHVGQYSPLALRRLLERAGFVRIKTETITMYQYMSTQDVLRPRAVARRAREAALMRASTFGSDPAKYDLLRVSAESGLA
jgi:2-polyprenyl-3-methyl-5-hydroxy-6-metoxy-1,4-benzoquinol methylase